MVDLAELDCGEELVDVAAERREAWFRRRRGKFTCSRFGDLMQRGRKKDEIFGQTAIKYIEQVAAERLGSFAFSFDSAPTRWGVEHEPIAIRAYLERYPAEQVVTGEECFHQLDEYSPIAGTPDGLIGSDGCIEVKCPYTPQEHFRVLRTQEVPPQYRWQVLGHLLITGRAWCDFVSFDPRIDRSERLAVVRVLRSDNKEAIDELSITLSLAVARMESMLKEASGEAKEQGNAH